MGWVAHVERTIYTQIWAATWAITVIVGLLLRRLVFDRGIATPFIIVATITLGVLLALGRLLSRKLNAKTS